jgi:TRAP-type C4-dicarboxylate transport system substrate-binding protein
MNRIGSRFLFTVLLSCLCLPALAFGQEAKTLIILKNAQQIGQTHFLLDPKTGPSVWWANELERRSGGRVKVKFYLSETLGKAKEMFDLARTGIAEMSGGVQGYTPGYFPLTTIAQLPYPVGSGMSYSVVAKALWQLHKKGLLDKTYNEVKVLSLDPTDVYQLFSKKKVMKLEDLKGMKIRSAGGEWPNILNAWGGTAVPVTVADMYLALRNGVIEALMHNWAAAPSWKTYDMVDYVIETHTSCAPLFSVMNLKTWNSFPPDIQKILDDLNEEFVGVTVHGWEAKGLLGYELYGTQEARPLFIKKGVKVYDLPPAEMERLRKAIIPLWETWAKDMEKNGLPGNKVMKEYVSILKSLGAKPVYEPPA